MNVKRDGLHKHMHLPLIKKDKKNKNITLSAILKNSEKKHQKSEYERLLQKLYTLVVQISDVAV